MYCLTWASRPLLLDSHGYLEEKDMCRFVTYISICKFKVVITKGQIRYDRTKN